MGCGTSQENQKDVKEDNQVQKKNGSQVQQKDEINGDGMLVENMDNDDSTLVTQNTNQDTSQSQDPSQNGKNRDQNSQIAFDTSKKRDVQRIRVADDQAAINTNWGRLAKQVFTELNRIRQNPKCIIKDLHERMKNFDNDKVLKRQGELNLKTKEGQQAVQDLLTAIESQKQLQPFQWDEGLAQTAYDHAIDIGPQGLSGQLGSNQSEPFDRIQKYGTWEISARENYAYSCSTGLEVILQMLIDDGVKTRPNRANIFNTSLQKVGISCYLHSIFRKVFVITFVGEYENLVALPGRPLEAEAITNPTLTNIISEPVLNLDSRQISEVAQRETEIQNERATKHQKIFDHYKPGTYGYLAFQLFELLNKIRVDPTFIIPDLEQFKNYFKGNLLLLPDRPPRLTFEGVIGVQKAIQFLKLQNPVEVIEWDNHLVQATYDQASFIGRNGNLNHIGDRGMNLAQRLSKYGEWQHVIGESIACDSFNAKELLIKMIIDDGTGSQIHRINLFNPIFKKGGVFCCPHQFYDLVCVINLAGGFVVDEAVNLEDREYQFDNIIKPPIENIDLSNYVIPSIISNVDNDPDKPANAVQLRVTKMTKVEEGQKIIIIQKTYTLNDGQEKIIIKEEKQGVN